jgi:hypothetical protein
VRAGADARTRLELALIKAARPEADGSMRALLSRIERLEEERAGATQIVPAIVPASRTPEPSGAERRQAAQPEHSVATVLEPAPEPQLPAPAALEPPAPVEPSVHVEPSLESLAELWPAVVEIVRGENALLGALIAEARPVSVAGEELTVAFGSPFLKKKAEDPANRMMVGEALRVITTTRWRLIYELREDLPTHAADGAEEHSEERRLARFMEEFDAEEVPGEWGSATAREASEPGEAQTVNGNEKGA